MMHNGSPNVSDYPRLGLFARWHHKDWKDMRYDKGGILSSGDLWKYWSDEVKQVSVELPRAESAAKL
jgi:hypothetical protein